MSRLFFFTLLLIVFLDSCTNSTQNEDDAELIITFTDNWLCSSCDEGFLFYSKTDGTLLWSGNWAGNDTVNVEMNDIPDRVSITTITSDETGTYINLTTNYSIVPASWHFKGQPQFETIGSITLDFQNVPEHQGYIIASKMHRRSSTYGTISSPYNKNITTSPDNLYIRVNTIANGPSYMWIENVFNGETRTVDLLNLQPLQPKEIALPTSGEEISFNLRAYFNQDYYSGYYDIDYAYGLNYNQAENNHTVFYPPGLFSEYCTRFYLNEEAYPTYNWWNHMVIGNIPGELKKMSADFEFTSTDPTNFEINATGVFNAVGSQWKYEDDNGHIFLWSVYSSLQNYKLPELPASVVTKYPGLSSDLFSLTNASITEHLGIQSQDELLKKMFHQGLFYYNFVDGRFQRSKDPNGLR